MLVKKKVSLVSEGCRVAWDKIGKVGRGRSGRTSKALPRSLDFILSAKGLLPDRCHCQLLFPFSIGWGPLWEELCCAQWVAGPDPGLSGVTPCALQPLLYFSFVSEVVFSPYPGFSTSEVSAISFIFASLSYNINFNKQKGVIGAIWRDIYTYHIWSYGETFIRTTLKKLIRWTNISPVPVLACGDAVIGRLDRQVLGLTQHMGCIHCAQMLLSKWRLLSPVMKLVLK